MRQIFLIARREYRQHLRTRGFWLGLLAIPFIMVASVAVPLLLDSTGKGGDALLISDPSGQFQPEIEAVFEREYQKLVLRRLSLYAEEYDAHPANVPIDWARHSLFYSNQETDAFVAAGGIDAALVVLRPYLPAGAAPFDPVPRPILLSPFPAEISPLQSASALDAAIPSYLQSAPMIDSDDGPRRVIGAVILPASAAAGSVWRLWSNGSVGNNIPLISDTVDHIARDQAMASAGFARPVIDAIWQAGLIPDVHAPPRRNAVSTDTVRQLIPVGCSWMLWMTIIMVSNVLLHGVIEERSNRLIESLLATVTSQQLMVGKLLGVAAIGFTVAVTWSIFALACVGFAPPEAGLVLRPALEPYESATSVVSLTFYFITGYLAIATLFLVIGSMCDSMHDAQAYMTPLILLLLAPLVLLRPALSDPHGLLPVIMSWVPIYTPFVMLGRLGTGVSMIEIATSSVFLLCFVGAELIMAGRVFRASLLRTGQPPRFAALIRLCFARGLT
jgi:ABC-2 type transport system permease protein